MALTFLSKLGSIAIKGVSVALGLLPQLASIPGAGPAAGAVFSELAQIAGVIVHVEAMGQVLGIKGPDKLKAAIPLVAQVVLASPLFANKKVADLALFNTGVEKLAGGFADVLNSIHPDGVKEEKKA